MRCFALVGWTWVRGRGYSFLSSLVVDHCWSSSARHENSSKRSSVLGRLISAIIHGLSMKVTFYRLIYCHSQLRLIPVELVSLLPVHGCLGCVEVLAAMWSSGSLWGFWPGGSWGLAYLSALLSGWWLICCCLGLISWCPVHAANDRAGQRIPGWVWGPGACSGITHPTVVARCPTNSGHLTPKPGTPGSARLWLFSRVGPFGCAGVVSGGQNLQDDG